jgi:hypothetical protein
MTSVFSATARQNQGRRFWIVDFRHPARPDPSNHGKPGRKVRKGLGTVNQSEAQRLTDELNRLLADPSLHSPAARAKAERLFDPRVVEIFYDGIEPKNQSYRLARDEKLPFPRRDEGYPRVLLLGVPGAGKTTLLRQLIGAHPDRDRFPATSVNRTTTCETEVIVGPDEFTAVVTFMSEEETDFEIRQSLSGAILHAIDAASDDEVAKVLLERSDMRFRLKYVLGGPRSEEPDADPYETGENSAADDADRSPLAVSAAEAEKLAVKLGDYVARLRALAVRYRQDVEKLQGPLDTLTPDERNTALDWIQEIAEQSEDYAELASDLLDDLRERFESIPFGRLVKTTTGWPRLWLMSAPAKDRADFLAAVRLFSGNDRRYWGKLFTPLVNGIRVAGPFSPVWASGAEKPRLVLIDTEGLGHKANTTPDVPDHIVSRLPEADAILLVDSAENGLASFAAAKALEVIGSAGQTAKTILAFSHMDAVRGDNIKGWHAKRDYVFGGVRNVIDHQIAKSLTPDVARFMLRHLERNTFFLGSLQEADAKPARGELSALLTRLTALAPPPAPARAFPEYSFDLLVLALREGVEGFRVPWRAYLNLERHGDLRPLPWQSVKAVSRRYAEGFDDGYDIRPASNLLNTMSLAIARFLEKPVRWEGAATSDDKRIIIDRIKARVSQELARFCSQQLRERPRPEWQEAHAYRGMGSTYNRKMKIEAIYERWVPLPEIGGDTHVQEFIDDVKTLVKSAIAVTRESLAVEPASVAATA